MDKYAQKCVVFRDTLNPSWDDFSWKETPRSKKMDRPVFFKQYESDIVVELEDDVSGLNQKSVFDSIQERRSVREYLEQPLTFKEFSYIVLNTCKVVKISEDKALSMGVVPVPGAIKSLETYIYVKAVHQVKPGLYHYNLVDGKLYLLDVKVDDILIEEALRKQTKGSRVVFFFTTTPSRTEYKYSYLAHKMIAMEAGHACQNLYISCTSIGLGTVAIGAFSQNKCDNLLGIDGKQEFTFYIAPVGIPKPKEEIQ